MLHLGSESLAPVVYNIGQQWAEGKLDIVISRDMVWLLEESNENEDEISNG
jgi:hypothetical protein